MSQPPPQSPPQNRVVREFKVLNAHGLHARSGALLVKTANRYPCEIQIAKDGTSVNAKSIMGVLMLAAARGMRVRITCTGGRAQECLDELARLIANRFGESR